MYLRSTISLDLKLVLRNLFVRLSIQSVRHTENNLKREGGPNIRSRKHDFTATQGTQYHLHEEIGNCD